MRIKPLSVVVCMFLLLAVTGSIAGQEMGPTTFTVRIANISGNDSQVFSDIGLFAIPVGTTEMRDALPGEAYEFTAKVSPGAHLSFAFMYAESNDSFFATVEGGIPLFDDAGNPVNGDVTEMVSIWQAGTEVNEPLGQGPNQGPRQPAPDSGETELGTVDVVESMDANGQFPDASDAITVTTTFVELDEVLVRIENHSEDVPVPTPIAPGIFVVHTADQTAPFFTTGEPDRGQGLENLAEDGNPQFLAASLAGSAVMDVGASPGNYVVHSAEQLAPFFTRNEADRGQGLEAQAEDGSPTPLSEAIAGMGFSQFGVFNTPVGADMPGPLMRGQSFEFSFTAVPGDRLSLVLMFGQSNDLFFSPDENGITLFNPLNGMPVSGPITGDLLLWDAGTEVNEEPFVGPNQAPRQEAPNTGPAEGGVVQPIYAVDDGFVYPAVLSSLRVTITNDMMPMMDMEMTDEPMMGDMMTEEPMMDDMADMEMTDEAMMDDTMDEMMMPEATAAS